jgi:hypothetical protein
MGPLALPPQKFMRPTWYFQLQDIEKHAVCVSPNNITIIRNYLKFGHMVQNLEGGYTHHGNPMNIDLPFLPRDEKVDKELVDWFQLI